MVMEYHEVSSWKDYWKLEPHLMVNFISDVMLRNRFLQILSNIYINDNNAMPQGSKGKL